MKERIGKKQGNIILPASAAALFYLGGELLLPEMRAEHGADRIAAFVLGLLFLSAAAPGLWSVFSASHLRRERGIFSKLLLVALGLLGIGGAFYVAMKTAADFSEFSFDVMLLRQPSWIISGLFLAFSAYLGSKDIKTIKKYALVVIVLAIIITSVLLCLSIPEADIRQVNITLGEFNFNSAVRIFLTDFLPVTVLMSALFSEERRRESGVAFPALGLAVAAFLLLRCYFNVVLIFDGSFAATLKYPYSAAVSTVTLGDSFFRMEGLSYLVCFGAGTLRCAACISLFASVCHKLISPRMKKAYPAAVFAGALFIFLLFRN